MFELESSGKAQIVERLGIRYRSASPSIYPDVEQSERRDVQKVGDGFRGDKNEKARNHEQ